ncbi:Small acid-soluble spore protein P (Minor) [Paenibacillus lactis]|jgi:hypothetical protein|uniref:Uncharacterized protein n=2 Tax=Paenibacillus lactis TaxID=228574 RepID=G4HMR1_9BACL|nr:hypothetical protein PaelaDRAFT_5272 [Paenibacillus lactis 154]MBP1891535.1 hypothetical protein [Paenibacillus lactis]
MSKNNSKEQEQQKRENKERRGEPIVDKKQDGINYPAT